MYRLILIAMMVLSSLQSFSVDRDTISMDESWLFLLSDDAASVPKGFETAKFNDSQWQLIKMPAHWRVRDYQLTKNYVGTYRGWIKMPSSFADRQTILHIGNCTSTATLWINGYMIGRTDPNVAFKEFNVTSYLRPAFNLFVIQMPRWDVGDKVHDLEAKSGITSYCYLYGLPYGKQLVTPIRPEHASGGKINGVRLRVADRNDLAEASGYIDTEERMLEDIKLLKQMNFNSVTFNKASSDPLFARLCAENGLALVADDVSADGKKEKLVDENRHLTAAGTAAKYRNQYIVTDGKDLRSAKLIVTNESPDQNLLDGKMDWELLADGQPVQSGVIQNLNIPSRQTLEIPLNYSINDIAKSKELVLRTVFTSQKERNPIAYNVNRISSFDYSDAVRAGMEASLKGIGKPKPRLNNKKKDALTIWDTNYSLQIDKNTGLIQTYLLNGVQLITYGGTVRPNISTRLVSLDVKKPNKVRGTRVTAVFNTKKGEMTWTYTISPSGVLTIQSSNAEAFSVVFPEQLSQTIYYTWEEMGDMLGKRVKGMQDDIRWWKQTDASGHGVQLIGNSKFYAVEATKPNHALIYPGVRPFELTFLPI